MAEMAVSLAQDKLLPLISNEAKLLWDIPEEFEEIKNVLQYVQAFLKDADRRAADGDNPNEGIKTWVKELREASFRIEDVIDEYMILMEQQPHDSRCAALLCQIFLLIETLMPRHRIASEIQQIKSVADRIMQRGIAFNFINQIEGKVLPSQQQSVQWHDPRLASPHLDEAEIFGFEGQNDELIGWLVDGPSERIAISVVGMGGVGKTTLVGNVFNNQKVIAHFGGCRAWITVSQSYTVEGLLKDLLEKLCKEKKENPPHGISQMDLYSLIVEVKSYLQRKRYVVVFDDVWCVKLWGQIENAMLDNKNGSRILITTRKKDVVDSCMITTFDKVHELKPLIFEKSMELFCKKAFLRHNNGCCPDDLIKISSDFVNKCKGLPLAIVTIGSLLSNKEKTPYEWTKIWQSLCSEMEKNPHLIGIIKILDFSYDDLPYYLKSCLLYFGLYPEDYEVGSKRLTWQWIAEGFVKEEGKTLEDTAQEYLTELIKRSLVQVSSFSIDGKAKRCRVHDLLHDMILRKSKDLSFCQHIGKKDELTPKGMIRRLSIAAFSNDVMENTESLHTRSLLVFADEEKALTNKFVQRIPTKYKLLKVLDFENWLLYSVSIPENWGILAHLKYLNLRYSKMPTRLPKFICKLHNLETLDIRKTDVRVMPKEICKLRKLRHLLGDYIKLFELKNGLGGMTSLQTLRDVDMVDDDDDGIELIRELGKLKELRNLRLTLVKEEHGSTLCSSLNEMTNLEKLQFKWNGYEDIDFLVISSLPMLRNLWLRGKFKEFPEWIPRLQNVAKLTLGNSKLTNDPLKSLQHMPHLLFLKMVNAYVGESLYFENGGFHQLRELTLGLFSNLKSIIIDRGALHSLEKLQLWALFELKTVPSGIQHLEKLEVLDILHMPNKFNKCIALDEGLEHPVIHHVPLIKITTGPYPLEKTYIISHSMH